MCELYWLTVHLLYKWEMEYELYKLKLKKLVQPLKNLKLSLSLKKVFHFYSELKTRAAVEWSEESTRYLEILGSVPAPSKHFFFKRTCRPIKLLLRIGSRLLV